MELLWDRGTILVEGEPPSEALGFVRFDPRVRKYRCMAIHYQRLKSILEEKGVRFEDRVLQPACNVVEAKVKPELRHYQREAL